MPGLKRLTLVRHADALPAGSGTDAERPLSARGRAEAESLAGALRSTPPAPDLVVVSPATRARQTAAILAQELGTPSSGLVFEPRLYLAGPETLLERIQQTDRGIGHLLVVGHNPGISELARRIAPAGAPVVELGTAWACALGLATDDWALAGRGVACAIAILAPRPAQGG